MKKTIAIAAIMVASTQAKAGGSAGFGFLSNYVFRGAEVERSVAYASADYNAKGFYVGTWLGDTTTAELDVYLGYLGDISKNVRLGLGVTAYEYLDDSARGDRQAEANAYARFGIVGFEFAAGQDKDDPTAGKKGEIDYTFGSLTIGNDITGFTVGQSEFDKKAGYDQSDDSRGFAEYFIQGEINTFDMRGLIGYATEKDGATSLKKDGAYVSIKVSKKFDF